MAATFVLTSEHKIQPAFPTASRAGDWRARLASRLGGYVLPFGLFVLLTGLFWAGDRTLYHKLFYALVALPAFIAAVARPTLLRDLACSPISLPFLAFSAFTLLSIVWSGTDADAASLFKRPLYVALLFVATLAVQRAQPNRIRLTLTAAVATSVLAGLVSLALFAAEDSPRLSGYGALYNPLLTSHVFGFFLALCIASWLEARKILPPAIAVPAVVLGLVIVATGSRTPLVGIAATVLWLAALSGDRRAIVATVTLAGIGLFLALLLPDLLTGRGLSYRPEIWREAWRQILEAPFLGHGYDHPLGIHIDSIPVVFRDPHNMLLAILYYGGFVGLVLWCWLYGAAAMACWRQRRRPMVFVCSATLIYGLAASMTEGGSFLSRPKEHWFLIWIPFALLAATTLRDTDHGSHARQD